MKKKKRSKWTIKAIATYEADGGTYHLYGFDPPLTTKQIQRHLFWMDIVNYFRWLFRLEELPAFKYEEEEK